DSAGDVIHYSIVVDNSGNASLTGVTVSDQVEAFAGTTLTLASGDTHNTGVLDVDETWTYSADYTVTQADIDNNAGGDGIIHNVATVHTNQTPDHSADASVTVVQNPHMSITKTASVEDGHADHAGDIIDYTVTLTNDGNMTLDHVHVTDVFEP